jgi:hypothetical protein
MSVYARVGVCVRALARVYGCGWIVAGACLNACSLTYLAYNAHPPYCLRPLWFHHIFRHYLINGTIFGKKVIEHKMCVMIVIQIVFETFLILRRIHRVIGINVETSSRKLPFILVRF